MTTMIPIITWMPMIIGSMIMLLGSAKIMHALVTPYPRNGYGSGLATIFIGVVVIGSGSIMKRFIGTPQPGTPPEPTTEPVPSPEPAPTPQPAPEPIDINWELIGHIALIIAGVIAAIAVIATAIYVSTILMRKRKRNKLTYEELTARFDHQCTRLADTMAAFSAATVDPISVIRYPLYLTSNHPLNRNFVDAMMNTYAEQEALEARIASTNPRDAGAIDIEHFIGLVNDTVNLWSELDYEAKKVGSPLLPLDLEERAQKLLALATDETNYTSERKQAMDRLITLLTDARATLRGEDAVLVDAMCATLRDAQHASNTLVAPHRMRELVGNRTQLAASNTPAIEA